MKKLFKRGLIALTLMLGMTFAAPQSVSAKYIGSKTKYYPGEAIQVISTYDDGRWVYTYDLNGNFIWAQWQPNDGMSDCGDGRGFF